MQIHVYFSIHVGNRASFFVAFDYQSSDSDVLNFQMHGDLC